MSRHRNVRSMNYQDEYDGYDDVYGHSVEDDFCVSPGTAAQFLYNRDAPPSLSSFMASEEIPEEEEYESEEEHNDSLQDSTSSAVPPGLTDIQTAQLNSCLEEMRNILGETVPERVMVDAVIKSSFDQEKALNAILSQQDAPKPQRQPRENRRNRGAHTKAVSANKREDGKVVPPTENDLIASAATYNSQTEDANENRVLPEAITRMTFSTGSESQVGFTPDPKGADVSQRKGDKGDSIAESAKTVNAEEKVDDREVQAATASGVASLTVPKKETRDGTSSPVPKAKSKHERVDLKEELEKRKAGGKDSINLVIIGHVDAGKSTLMGHVLFQLGFVQKRTMHKYEQEAKKIGKASFAYAWVLDETEEERSRGVTMDIAQTRFETTTKIVTLLDAPGHKDFIPNMITGAAQADCAVLVVNSTRGEFETGFETGGQTREHAMLIRSLGVSQLVVAVNKMDTVSWDEERFKEITKKLGQFLKQAGFKETELSYIPCSGLSGENLTKAPTEPNLASWYKGSCLVDAIDKFRSPERQIDKPLRMCVSDVFKGMGSGLSVAGTLQAGSVQPGDKVVIMPQGSVATVKSVAIDDVPQLCAFAGDSALVVVTGIDFTDIAVGSILCEHGNPIQVTTRLRARVVVFNIDIPLTKGFPVVFHYQSMSEHAHIQKLICQLHKSTGEVVKKKPRCLTKNSNALIELVIGRPICIELYKDYKDLGRFMLRYGGSTIAAGLVTEIMKPKSTKEDN